MDEKIIELRRKGYTYTDIRKELGCTLLTIQKVCNRNGVILNIVKLSDEKIEELKKIYKETGSQRKTAEIIGCSKSTVGKYVTGINYYKNTPQTKVQSVINWRKRTKEKLVEYKGGKCVKCGYDKCIQALSFHHIDPKEKDFTISGKSWSYERLKNEVDKCILVCSNCHIEIHSKVQ